MSGLMIALLFGGFTHATVEHNHGHHDATEIVWESLHSALSSTSAIVFAVAALAVFVLTLSTPTPARVQVVFEDMSHLRRGVYKYRRFR